MAGLVAAGWYATVPVLPRDAGAPDTGFSADRAMVHVEEIAAAPHPMGSTAIERVRDHLVVEVEALGLEIDLQTVPARDVYGDGAPIDVVNVIAWIPGAANTKAVVIVGHYDTVPTTPGANDNSTAVAAMLETARALQAGPPLANDVVFCFTDGEEPSERFGARGFASVPGLLDSLGLVVNLEANGADGASTLVETSGPESWLLDGYASAATAPAAFSFLTELTRLIGDVGTDFDVFSNAGLPGLHFAYLRGSPIYHTMADDIDSVGHGSLQHHGENALAVARHFGNVDLDAVPAADRSVFFTVGAFLVRYPAAWSLVVAAVVAALLGLSLVWPAHRAPPSLRSVARSAAAVALGALVGAGLGTAAWLLLVAVRPSPSVLESYLALAVLGAGAVLAARPVVERIGGRGAARARHGVVALWAVLALVTAVALPGASYLFAWPALAGVAGLRWRTSDQGWALARFATVAAPTLLLVVPAVDHLFLLSQPRPGNPDSEVLLAAIVPLLLLVLVIALLDNGWHRPDDRPGGRGGCLGAGLRRGWSAPVRDDRVGRTPAPEDLDGARHLEGGAAGGDRTRATQA